MTYFTYLPTLQYWNKTAPNILTRVALGGSSINNLSVYLPYTIKDGDRPDTIAYYYYGDENLDWLILLANNIFDLVSQWPLTSQEFDAYMTNKYGDITNIYSKYDHFELFPNIPNITPNQYSILEPAAQKYWAWNDYHRAYVFIAYNLNLNSTIGSYNLMDASEKIYWQPISLYDMEHNENEKKRYINVIDREYASLLKSEIQTAMQG